ncbi:hypothetical protein, partial [Nonomuraea jabiensis]|uniref:hypothetical protein n=1 Tax=Nonomuraea jabiensis TaxID=882448 RepID=UPI003D7564A2
RTPSGSRGLRADRDVMTGDVVAAWALCWPGRGLPAPRRGGEGRAVQWQERCRVRAAAGDHARGPGLGWACSHAL